MTSKFPARLETYFFISQSVDADPEHKTDEPAKVVPRVKATITPSSRGDGHYSVMVSVDVNEEESFNIDYRYKFIVLGSFIADEALPQSSALAIIRELGVSLLVGTIRERLALLSSSGPWSTAFLDFVPLSDIEGITPAATA